MSQNADGKLLEYESLGRLVLVCHAVEELGDEKPVGIISDIALGSCRVKGECRSAKFGCISEGGNQMDGGRGQRMGDGN